MMLAMLTAAAFADFAMGWHAITADEEVVSFYLRSSITGPHDARRVTALTIKPKRNAVINSTRFTLEINCLKKTGRYLNFIAFADKDIPIPQVSRPRAEATPIQPASIGYYLWVASCEPAPDALGHYIPIMVDPYIFADQVIRIQRVGVAEEFAIAMAAIDPKIAPETYEQSLNAMVPLSSQTQVRAIKEVSPVHPSGSKPTP